LQVIITLADHGMALGARRTAGSFALWDNRGPPPQFGLNGAKPMLCGRRRL